MDNFKRFGNFEKNYSTKMCSGSEAGSYSRPIDIAGASLNSRLESNKEEEEGFIAKRLKRKPEELGCWEGCRENRRCSRDAYPESHITKHTRIQRLKRLAKKGLTAKRLKRKPSTQDCRTDLAIYSPPHRKFQCP